MGIPWKLHMHVVVDDKIHFEPGVIIHPVGGGLGQLKIWRELALRLGVEIRYDSAVTGILGTASKVEGVTVTTADGRSFTPLRDVRHPTGAIWPRISPPGFAAVWTFT